MIKTIPRLVAAGVLVIGLAATGAWRRRDGPVPGRGDAA